jgi:hypothetical protein
MAIPKSLILKENGETKELLRTDITGESIFIIIEGTVHITIWGTALLEK